MKKIKGFENYYVNENGEVFNNKYNKMRKLKPYKKTDGYLLVDLRFNGKRSVKRVHRLVVENYLPNPNNYTDVNHKDGDKSNNELSNLEWCSRSQNLHHAYDNELKSNKLTRKKRIEIVVLLKTGRLSQRLIARKVGVTQAMVSYIKRSEHYEC